MQSETKICQNCKQQFTIDAQDFAFYEKIQVPPPTFCPECRLVRRLAWRNEKALYKRSCDKCDKPIISVFSKDSGLTVYCNPCWWSDSWDGLEYGADFDPSRPFLVQLRELLQKTPVMALFGLYTTLENSDYTNMVTALKNCYLLTHSDYSENCAYGSILDFCKDSVDNLMLAKSELCYETVNCKECYQALFSVDCEGCRSVLFCRNCVGCSDCIGCVNLRNKQYCIFNRQYSKEEYEKLAAEYASGSHAKIQDLKAKAHDFWRKFPQKFMHERHNANVSGDYLYNSKNVRDTFIATDTEDSRYCSFITPPRVTNCYDFSHYGEVADLVYESLQIGNHVSRILFSWFAVTNNQDVEYSMFSIGNKSSFGTVSLKKRKHCILNKQYTQEEYEKLREQIMGQMKEMPYKDSLGNAYSYGEFFPIEMSPFGYNATTAQEFFPLTKEQATQKGYQWKEREQYEYAITLQSQNIPDSTLEISDAVSREVIGCEHQGQCNEQCSVAFKLIPSEIGFYQRMRLPLPRLCPNCRHHARLAFRNPMKLWKRGCQCAGAGSQNNTYQNTANHFHEKNPCPNEFETSFPPSPEATEGRGAPEKPDIIYCDQCYQAEVA